MHYTSKKCKNALCNVLVAKLLGFSAALDYGYTLRLDLEKIFNRRLPLQLFTDSNYIFDAIIKAS